MEQRLLPTPYTSSAYVVTHHLSKSENYIIRQQIMTVLYCTKKYHQVYATL